MKQGLTLENCLYPCLFLSTADILVFSLVSFFPTGRMSFLSNTVHNFSMSFVYAIFKQTKLYIMSLQHQNKLKYIQCALYLCSVHTNKKRYTVPKSQYKTVLCCYLHYLFSFVLSICMSIRYSVPPTTGFSTAPYELCT